MTRGIWIRAAALAVLMASGGVLAMTAELPRVGTVRGWLDGVGGAGWLLLTVAVGLTLLTPVPRTAVSVLVGVVAGFPAGLPVALVGGLLGGLVAFALSRWLGRAAVARIAGARMAQVDRFAGERGFVAVLSARLLPLLPFTVVSYAAGLTGIRLLPYAAATALGLLPSTVAQVGLGASATWITAWAAPLRAARWPLVLSAAVVGVAGAWWWYRRTRRPAVDNPVRV